MARFVILSVVAAMFAFAWWSPVPQDRDIEVRSLLNGANLEGWYTVGGGATFAVEDGEIVGTRGPGDNTFLRTEEQFRDFELTLQVRWDEPGNSGVMFRAAQRGGDGRTFGYQYELDPSQRAWTGGIYDEARRGWLQNTENNPAARQAIRLDDWNDVRIEARGPVIRTWLNDVPAADIVDAFDAEGFIALQVHAGDRGVIRWRNIRLRELSPLGNPGPALDDRRQLTDFVLDFEMPVCAEPGVVRVREAKGMGGVTQAVQLELTDTSASGALVGAETADSPDPVTLDAAPRHRVRIAAHGERVVLSVNEQDVLRLSGDEIPPRGKLVVQTADCAEPVELAELAWTDLTPRDATPAFYQTLATEPAPVYSPVEALETFRIAPGYVIEPVATEPLIGDPVAAAWDEFGRLYVVEMRSYMPDAYGSGRGSPLGRVVRLSDTNLDGRMDTSEVFLDGLTYPRAVAIGNDGVLIGEPPNLWLCPLPSRDSLCTGKRRLGEYGVVEGDGNVEHLENKLLPGLDNWYYNAKSSRALRIVDGELETRHSLFRGQWGMGRDDWGRLFYNHNSNLVTADFFAAEDLFEEATTQTADGLGELLSPPEEVFSVRVNPGVNRAYVEGTLREDGRLKNATSASGLAVYRGDLLQDLRGDVFVAEPAANVVAQFSLAEDGVELQARHRLYDDPDWGQREFLGSTDERFRPVDVMNGPDGALYLVDMYRGLIQDEHYLTEQLREQVLQRRLDAPIGMGRIWRVRGESAAEPLSVMPGDMDGGELVQALSSENGWLRDTAQRLLLNPGFEVSAALVELVSTGSPIAATHALWALQGRNELDAATVRSALSRTEPRLRQQALRAGGDLLAPETLIAFARESLAAPVRMQLAFTLRRHTSSDPVQQALLALLAGYPDDPFLRQAGVRAVEAVAFEFLQKALAYPALASDSGGNRALLSSLAGRAYRELRGDLDATGPAPAALEELLALVAAQQGEWEWAQLAMLDGLQAVSRSRGFTAAELSAAPPIFTDVNISESDPLWDARLGARRAFTWPGDELAAGITPLSPGQMALMDSGERFYPACGACHGPGGDGVTGLGPPLTGSPWVTGPPEHLGRIILQGLDTERNGVMPPHGHLAELDDRVLAGLMTFLRRGLGNTADPVSVEMAASIRKKSAARTQPWTLAELAEVEVDLGYVDYVGKYKLAGFMTMEVFIEEGALKVKIPMYGGGALTALGNDRFQAATGDQKMPMQFRRAADGRVDALLIDNSGQQLVAEKVE